MPTQLLSFGIPLALQTNVIYALPAAKGTVFCADTTPGIEVSGLFDFSIKQSLTLSAGVSTAGGKFVRSTAGTPTVVLSRD